jgi:hypothetical protein
MGDDGLDGRVRSGARQVSRRHLLQGMVALAALAACDSSPSRRPASVPLADRSPNAAGLTPFVLAMHLHASASEGVGSVRSQLAQAAANHFDAAWFSEHDWRRRRLLFRPSYSFTPDEKALGGIWTLPALPVVGSVTGDSGGQFVDTPTSPDDPATRKGSLRLRVTGSGSEPATVGHRVSSEGTSRANYRARIAGRIISVDVLPNRVGVDGWAEVFFRLSNHPGKGDRPTGVCGLLYRLRTDVSARSVSSDGLTGIVDLPVRAGEWQKVSFDLVRDVGDVWSDMDPRDNSLNDIRLQATSRGGSATEVFFGHLQLTEQAGYDAVGVEHDLVAAYADEVAGVLGLIGSEISLGPHLNQYGGTQNDYDYGDIRSLEAKPSGAIRPSIVEFIHAQGGLASINHPRSPGGDADEPGDSLAQAVARDLLSIGAGGADIIEVGYGKGGPATLPEKLAVWDALSRNGLFLTGNGASDDHSGMDWAGQENRFYTGAWAQAVEESALLDALARGQAYVGYLGSFGGTIDMSLDGDVPMGAVSVSPKTSRTLRIALAGLPDGAAVEVVRGPVDYAGPNTPDPGTEVVGRLGARDLSARSEVTVDTADECFVRLQVVDGSGAVVAFGQPTWALKAEPATGIPEARRAGA